jgi:XTP/dITP diphosphohydrolase
MELILASRNAHKLDEVSRMLAAYDISVQALPDGIELPPEDGDTYEANALPKARAAAQALGVAVIADDSGIESAALGGRPGVRSARFAGEHATDQENLDKLLREAPAFSELRYVCALAFVNGGDPADAPSRERVFFGDCQGRMAAAPRGDHGFGYDPVFVPDDLPGEETMAELSDVHKDSISHRGRAVRAFAEWYTGEGE